MWVLPSFRGRGSEPHGGEGNSRWRGRIDSRGKNLECDWSQFLLPPDQSVIPIDAKGEVRTEPELPASLTGFPAGAVQHVFGGGAKFEDVDFYILKAVMGWGEEMCTARTSSVGVADVTEVVVHPVWPK